MKAKHLPVDSLWNLIQESLIALRQLQKQGVRLGNERVLEEVTQYSFINFTL